MRRGHHYPNAQSRAEALVFACSGDGRRDLAAADQRCRLGLSLASAARGSNLPGVTTARILEQLASGYEKALSDDIERGKGKIYRPKRIQDLLEQSVRRRWRQLEQRDRFSRRCRTALAAANGVVRDRGGSSKNKVSSMGKGALRSDVRLT
jgi:uncharacterized protein (DUF2252 family)